MATPLGLDTAQDVLARQPFSTLLGARVTRFDTEAHLEVELRDELRQQHGFAHGGVLSYLADNSLTFAGGLSLGPEIVTGGFEITYLRPARGTLLRAEARVVTASASTATCRCEIFDAAETATPVQCASATGTVVRLRQRESGSE